MHVLRENYDKRSRSPLELKSIYFCIFPYLLRERLALRNWSLRLWRLRTPDPGEPMAWFQSESETKCRRRPIPSSETIRQRENSFLFSRLFSSDIQWIGWDPPTLGKVMCLFSPLDQMLISYKTPSKTHPEIIFNQIFGILWPNQLHIKLTIIANDWGQLKCPLVEGWLNHNGTARQWNTAIVS